MDNQIILQTVFVNGAEFHFIEQGSGEAVVFVHGSLGDFRSWMPQIDPFSQVTHAISYSRRYHYPNPFIEDGKDYSPDLHAEDLIKLIESLRLGPANVVGNSFGAYATLVAAIRRPELFRRLIIGEPPVLPWLKKIPGGQTYYDGFMEKAWIPAGLAFQHGDMEQGVRLFIDGVSGAEGIFDRLPEPVRARMMQNAPSLQAETASQHYFTEITPQQLEELRINALFLKGEHSPKMFHLIIDQLAQYVPGARQATIPDAGHSMPSNNPPAYNQAVLDFLAED